MSITFDRVRRGLQRRARFAVASMGSRVACPLCGWTGRRFVPGGLAHVPNRKCPRCGSLERYRMLALWLRRHGVFDGKPTTVMEVAPKPCLMRWCKEQPDVHYVGLDLDSPYASIRSDLTNLGVASDSLDLVLCFHVLEHIPNDTAAMAEIARVLRPDGLAIIQVPVRGETTLEDATTDPADYERLYGQDDHVRFYGTDIAERLTAAGLHVVTEDVLVSLAPELVERHALSGDDRIFFVCRPSA